MTLLRASSSDTLTTHDHRPISFTHGAPQFMRRTLQRCRGRREWKRPRLPILGSSHDGSMFQCPAIHGQNCSQALEKLRGHGVEHESIIGVWARTNPYDLVSRCINGQFNDHDSFTCVPFKNIRLSNARRKHATKQIEVGFHSTGRVRKRNKPSKWC